MTTEDLKQFLEPRTFRAELELSDMGLRVFLQDLATGECGVLAVEPVQLALPDERALAYSYQDISAELGPPPPECLILDLKTKVGPDFEKSEMPSLFN